MKELKEYEIVAGVDVSYKKFSDGKEKAKACYIAMNKDFEIVEKKVFYSYVDFPYIPTYFYYREGPIILKILNKVRKLPHVLLIDGNGMLHPRKLGIATIIGIKTKLPTIGIAKNLLLSSNVVKRVGDEIYINGEIVGKVLRMNDKELYISVGSNIDLNTSIKIVKEFSIEKYPEPLRLAHKFSRF